MVGGGDDGTNKILGVILILKRIIESVPEVYSLSKLLLHLESDDSAQATIGIDFQSKTMYLEDMILCLQLCQSVTISERFEQLQDHC
ncbi:hypothetical protein F2Q69_00013298 [Brassica cretica]|uniref:Uncharacterized protein n=1 Tax=Brassica cretica TaxID=69181 RepID=A0A8S9QSR3_BRACR|nr:hypothetical protein F2Q69_00013298 [Brassica cretica]